MGKKIELKGTDFGFSNGEEKIENKTQIDKATEIYNLVLPLLKNLMKDSSDTIHWPNRKESIETFIKKMDEVLNR